MLKKASSFVLVHPLHAAMQWVPVKASTSWVPVAPEMQRVTAYRSLRPRWTAFLNILDEVPSASSPVLTLLLSERHRGFSKAC